MGRPYYRKKKGYDEDYVEGEDIIADFVDDVYDGKTEFVNGH